MTHHFTEPTVYMHNDSCSMNTVSVVELQMLWLFCSK